MVFYTIRMNDEIVAHTNVLLFFYRTNIFFLSPSTFTDPMMLSSTASSSSYNNNNNNATIFHNTHGVTSRNHSEHPIVPFSTKVRSIFLESVLQHEVRLGGILKSRAERYQKLIVSVFLAMTKDISSPQIVYCY